MDDSTGRQIKGALPLKLLMVEDSAPDSLFELQVLRKAGYVPEVERVETAADMRLALQRPWDLILADYAMPGFSGMEALTVRNEAASDVPFILVSGQISVEMAVAVLKAGATDYVSKDQLTRLGLVVERALKQAESARERQCLQEQVIQSQKMEAVGQLAGGVAHDFNNLLQVIIGYAEILMLPEKKGCDCGAELKEIQSAAVRAAELTRQLLSFSRRQRMVPSVLDVNSILMEMRAILEPLMGETITLAVRLEDDLPPVFADAGHLEQAIMNMVMNGKDAMPEGGQLGIETAAVVLDGEEAGRMMGARAGRFVTIRITDSGCGMEPAVMARVFEPFFTTQGLGKRTGLGLAVTYGIVREHNGWIQVSSHPGKGTCFTLYLPAAGLL
jgi:signal transduction histidine kinase